MSDDTPTTSPDGAGAGTDTSEPTPSTSAPSDSPSKTQSAIQSLSFILPSTPPPSLSSALSLLHDPEVSVQISSLLCHPNFGASENNLCYWLYDTFQSGDPSKTQSAIQSLSSILPSTPPSLSSAFSLLHDPEVAAQISSLLCHPNSGADENNLCRWPYDTFQSGDPDLQLVALRFLPIIADVYLSCVTLRKPANPTLASRPSSLPSTRTRPPHTLASVPDLSHPSVRF